MRHPGRSDGQDRSTIRDVAVAAGVSTATVSRALSRPELVTQAPRRRVRAAATALHYVPNASARALSSLHSGRSASRRRAAAPRDDRGGVLGRLAERGSRRWSFEVAAWTGRDGRSFAITISKAR